jgi:hypothetical protein
MADKGLLRDITAEAVQVEISTRNDKGEYTVWVNIPGGCVLRVIGIKLLEINKPDSKTPSKTFGLIPISEPRLWP